MSLIITSSKQDKYSNSDISIESPYSYKNQLSSVMTIPPHSEVAVQSVKLSRSNEWVFKDDDNAGYLAFGKKYTHRDDILTLTNIQLSPLQIAPGAYSNEGGAVALKKAISKIYNRHPDTGIVDVAVNVETTAFHGYNMTLLQNHGAPQEAAGGVEVANVAHNALFFPRPIIDTRDISPSYEIAMNTNGVDSTWVELDGNPPTEEELQDCDYVIDCWTPATKTLKGPDNLGGGWCGGIFPQYPLSHQGGIFEWEPPIGEFEWHVALTRELACGDFSWSGEDRWQNTNEFDTSVPEYMAESDKNHPEFFLFGDYWIGVIHSATGGLDGSGGYELQCGYFGFAKGSQGTTLGSPTDVRSALTFGREEGSLNRPHYWEESAVKSRSIAPHPIGTGVDIAYDWGTNSAKLNITKLRIVVEGEEVLFQAYYSGSYKDVISVATTPNYDVPSTTTNNWSLYPKIFVQDVDDVANELQITSFMGRDMSITNADVSASWEWYGQSQYAINVRDGDNIAEDIDRRPTQDPDYGYTKVDINGNKIIQMTPLFVLEHSQLINPISLISHPIPHMEGWTGFDKELLDVDNATGASDLATKGELNWISVNAPQVGEEGGYSLFVRCNELTHQSYNFGKGAPSKILHQIPQFDNTGASTGSLYFEAHEKTYLKLHNTENIELNNISIDIVDRNEKYATGLSGTTVVVLHIK